MEASLVKSNVRKDFISKSNSQGARSPKSKKQRKMEHHHHHHHDAPPPGYAQGYPQPQPAYPPPQPAYPPPQPAFQAAAAPQPQVVINQAPAAAQQQPNNSSGASKGVMAGWCSKLVNFGGDMAKENCIKRQQRENNNIVVLTIIYNAEDFLLFTKEAGSFVNSQ
ncbi:unnamed protein product [Lupinus luteus]|uniref:Uncharacterized protein n=1 Tax=Lupinus luteus TaxID=3873 RepID=A0AAV1W9X2_LUPLU